MPVGRGRQRRYPRPCRPSRAGTESEGKHREPARMARDDDPLRPPRRPRGDRRRRPGDARHDRHEGRRREGSPATGRPGHRRIRRQRGGRVRADGAVRSQVEGLPEQRPPRRDRTGEAVADRPGAPAPGGDAGRLRRPVQPARLRLGRRDPALRRHPRHRLGRRLCARRGAGADGPHGDDGGGDRPQGAGDRGRDRHLYEREPDGRGTRRSPRRSAWALRRHRPRDHGGRRSVELLSLRTTDRRSCP